MLSYLMFFRFFVFFIPFILFFLSGNVAFAEDNLISSVKNESGSSSLDLRKYQTRDGLLITFKNGDVADPYFGLYSLE
ncbi:hypothetical protein ABHC15_02135, partial [Escherichia coli]